MTDEMGLFDVMFNCRAMRRIDSKEVPEELLVKLIDAANQAPSGSNVQNGRWIVVRDPDVKKALAELNRKAVEAHVVPRYEGGEESLPHHDASKRHRMLKSVIWQMEHMHEIPALVVALLEVEGDVSRMAAGRTHGSIWPGIQNLLLAARALGLGAAPTTLALGNADKVREILNLPDNMAPICLIPVGYPLGRFGPVTRRPVEEIMRWDRWS